MNFSRVCFLCLENHNNLLDIFGKQGIDFNIGAILQEHFWFKVNASDEKKICKICWKKVESFHIFYNFVKFVHQRQKTESIAGSEYNGLLDFIKVEPSLDIKDDLDQENFNVKHNLDQDLDDFTDIPSTIDSFAGMRDELKVCHNTDSAIVPREFQILKRTGSIPPSGAGASKKPATDSYTSLLSQYFNMSCDLCDAVLSSYEDANKHYKESHDHRNGYLVCCSKKFFRLPNMLQHCQWHVKHETFNCSQCSKTFSVKCRQDHLNNCHTQEKCDDFNDTFSKRHCVNAHHNQVHASDTLISPAKKPMMNSENEDDETIRNRFLMQCDLCGEAYSTFVDAQRHHLKMHRRAGYLQCCDRKFFKKNKAVEHCYWHESPDSFK